MGLVRPKSSFNSTLKDNPNGVVLSTSDILRDDNPHVKARPDAFEPVRATFGEPAGVEEATKRPGEKRAVKRAAKTPVKPTVTEKAAVPSGKPVEEATKQPGQKHNP